MILTVTPNPSIDRTITLPSALVRGAVQRVEAVCAEPGGKGVNVARALTMAGVDTVALLPARPGDAFLTLLAGTAVRHATVTAPGTVRTNLTLTEPDGTTTKLNEPGAVRDAGDTAALTEAVLARAGGADWVVLSGSLPPGMPVTWYADITRRLTGAGTRVAVDTSDAPLAALAAGFTAAAPDLIKPNAEELAGLVGADPAALESAARHGDPGPVLAAAAQLVDRGVSAVLATLGAAGAVLVNADAGWLAVPPPIAARSTVGAGDSSLAGYLRAEVSGAEPADCLAMAVAYGSAAAALPGSALPGPEQLDPAAVTVTALADRRS